MTSKQKPVKIEKKPAKKTPAKKAPARKVPLIRENGHGGGRGKK